MNRGNEPVLYRTYATSAELPDIYKHTRKLVTELFDDSTFRPWVVNGQLGVCVLCASSGLCATVRDTLLPKLISGEVRIEEATRKVEAAL